MPTPNELSTEAYRQRVGTLATERGDGPAVVCNHGTLMDRTMFAPQLDALSDEYRVVAYDSRARTDRYVGPYDLADDAAALQDALGIDSCVLVGMSMGGFVALRFAERYPGEAVYHELYSWLEREDFTAELSGIDVPVLVVHGEEDVSLEPARAEPMLDELPDARMELVPEGGHSSNLENPAAANRAIREFLA